MSIVSAIVLFAVLWWLTFFVLLPLQNQTQGEAGKVEPGTHASAPANFSFRRKAWQTTPIAVVLWAILAGTIWSGYFTVDDLGWFKHMISQPISSD